jgi:hypothetical protein
MTSGEIGRDESLPSRLLTAAGNTAGAVSRAIDRFAKAWEEEREGYEARIRDLETQLAAKNSEIASLKAQQ